MVHTGQHYDPGMSDIFFKELALRSPDYSLDIGSASHGAQTGRMLEAIEKVILEVQPDRVLVYGDTNSTLSGALAAAKLQIAVDHVEAGLRSFDRNMPEEINRVLTDHAADQLFCPTRTAMDNLRSEHLSEGAQHSGDVMLDLALEIRPAALLKIPCAGFDDESYFLATIHRASNTDDRERLGRIVDALATIGRRVGPVVLPAHPRLAARLREFGFRAEDIHIIEPVGYSELQSLILHARGLITDSGGVQKEALFHGVRCLTLRDTTEWVESVNAGMSVLVGDDLASLPTLAAECHGRVDVPIAILEEFGGGCAATNIAASIRLAGSSRRQRRS